MLVLTSFAFSCMTFIHACTANLLHYHSFLPALRDTARCSKAHLNNLDLFHTAADVPTIAPEKHALPCGNGHPWYVLQERSTCITSDAVSRLMRSSRQIAETESKAKRVKERDC
jgi:hypothetical protein